MSTRGASARYETAWGELLHRLIPRQGLNDGQYALLFVTGEGPGPSDAPVEEASGYVMDKHGRIFSFWLGGEANKQKVALTEWQEVQAEPHWAAHPEYRHTRAGLGLSAAWRASLTNRIGRQRGRRSRGPR